MNRFIAPTLLASTVIVGLFAGIGKASAVTVDHLSAPSAFAAATVSKVGWHYHRRRRCWWRHHRRHCRHWY